MTKNDAQVQRISSTTSNYSNDTATTGTGSTRSSVTVKPPSSITSVNTSRTGRGANPLPLRTDEGPELNRALSHGDSISPTTTTQPTFPSSNQTRDRRTSNLAGYRRELAALDDSNTSRAPQIPYNPPPPSAGILPALAPWMSGNGLSTPAAGAGGASFYHDSSDTQSIASQLSPGAQPSNFQPGPQPGSPEATENYDRRPSVASIATASSTGSKTSMNRGGFRKLQGFFGEEFPGRDSSENSLPNSLAKDQHGRSGSYSHSRTAHRDRKASNATSASQTRDGSPASSRPRTPVPKPEVVPFLYQDNTDIARYGEAPVRNSLTGPDRDRYIEGQSQTQNIQPKTTSSSNRSAHSFAHRPGHHRHNRSNDDPRSLRPTLSREDSTFSVQTTMARDKGKSSVAHSTRSRAQSPTPSNSSAQTGQSRQEDQSSPGHHGRFGLLGRLRRHHNKEEKEQPSAASRLKSLPQSTRSLHTKSSKTDLNRRELSPPAVPPIAPTISEQDGPEAQRMPPRGQTFNNKFPFAKKKTMSPPQEYQEESIGPTDRSDPGQMYHLDTNLNDMEGILTRPPALAPVDLTFAKDDRRESIASPPPKGRWDAPDSWAVRRNTEDTSYHTPEMDEIQSPPRPEEKLTSYCIRIFRSDGTFSTHSMPLDATVTDVVSQVIKKTYVVDGLENYNIIMKRHTLIRVLGPGELPLLIQKRLLQQAGYTEGDRIEDLGREDNSYLCRFMFLSSKESDFHSKTADLGPRQQKSNYVDLAGRNLITIPISLYSKAGDIVSLNLSRNLSLDVPRDFIQSCKHLRDIKFNNNEVRRLPLSLSRANKLTYLDVSNNRVDQLEHAELHTLNGLLKMSLANNRLTALPSYFGAYQSLRILNISSNFLEEFPAFLCELQSLVELDLSFNSIAKLPDQIGELKNLEKLLITNNRLTYSVPEAFDGLISLRELDIKWNGITSIDIISELPKLEVLYADHNGISAFTGKFERLRTLKLNSNPLNKFEITETLPTLKSLNLSNAQLASIDSAFQYMPNLEHLTLDKNYFVSLPAQLGSLLRLEHFSIANNSVGELPPQIGCLTKLKVLNVRGNNISKLPMEIWWARELETLNASSNVLDNFPKVASRPPRVPGEDPNGPPPLQNGKSFPSHTLSATPSSEELSDDRRPSQASSTLLSVGPSPVNDRKSSVVSLYGKGGRNTAVISRSASQGTTTSAQTPALTPAPRKDSSLSSRLTNTFAGSLKTLSLADNRLDDEVFDQITLLAELRILNLSYNDEITDMPQRSIKSWPQLVELYLSGNGLTTLPADDLEESSLLQTLYINGNKFTNLPADISRAKKLAVLDCGSNYLKYNISNVPYDWNWNLNPNLRYLNLSGNKKLEIKQSAYNGTTTIPGPEMDREQYTDFSRLLNLRILGLMDVTLTQPSIPDQSEDRRVRTSGSLAGHLPYGMADTLGRYEHLSTVDLVVPRFNSSETEMLLGLFDGQSLSSGGSKIAKYLHENFGQVFAQELKGLKTRQNENPGDALRRAFLAVNKDLATIAVQHTEDRPRTTHRGSAQPLVLGKEDLTSGGVATVVYLRGTELYVANVGDAQAMVIQTDGSHKILTRKHDPAESGERTRIREAGGWVSRNGRLNETLEVSRAFGHSDLMPIVQAAPFVSNMTMREQDDIILMATKELWEYLSPGLITDIARAERQDLMRAAQKLRDLAMAYGASGKIMVMMISVADLRRRVERSKTGNRGPSMSLYPSGLPDDTHIMTRRGRKAKGDVLDSSLGRLEAEIPAPTGNISIVFTDIKNSTALWEMFPNAMRSAIKLHNEVMRRQLRRIGGYEVKTEGDAFMVSFPTGTSALLWCFAVQLNLLQVEWPSEVLSAASAEVLTDKDETVIFKGLSVRMGIHFGDCVSETDPVTRRMDYFGPMVNKASRISAVADGGQIAVSSDFISEIQRCLENYQDTDRTGSNTSEEGFEEESYANSIRKDLRSLTSQGFEVKEMGEKKLKGLENPEVVYSLYPHALAGRIEYHQQLEGRDDEKGGKPATISGAQSMNIQPDIVWAVWKISLRLEMMCSSLENTTGTGLQPPETELIDRIKARGGELTERFLINFLEHQVSRIETCVTTLTLRHQTKCDGPLKDINQLRGPISDVLDFITKGQAQLARYQELYGPLPPESTPTSSILPASTATPSTITVAAATGLGITTADDDDDEDASDADGSDADSEGSDTEQPEDYP